MLGLITLYVAAHCRVVGTTYMLPTPQGYDAECCPVKVAVRLCRHVGVQFDSVAQIPCTLNHCGRKKKKAISIIFVFEGWARGFLETGELLSLHSALCIFVCGSHCTHHGGERSWLRNCATSRKVAGSIPDSVFRIFHRHNPSGRTMVLRSTQPLTEMSTRSISWRLKTAGA